MDWFQDDRNPRHGKVNTIERDTATIFKWTAEIGLIFGNDILKHKMPE